MGDFYREIAARLRNDIAQTRERLVELTTAYESLLPLTRRADQAQSTARDKSLTEVRRRERPKGSTRIGRRRRALPPTGAAFWLAILGAERRTGREIVDAAMEQLGLGEGTREKIYSRASNWFHRAIKRGLVVVAEERDGIRVYERARDRAST